MVSEDEPEGGVQSLRPRSGTRLWFVFAHHEACIGTDPIAGTAALPTFHVSAAKREQGEEETGQRPERNSLGLLPSGPDPVGERLVRRQPPVAYIAARAA